MDLGLNGKVVMITGASKGLGRAMVQAFAAEGARISMCARGAEALAEAEKGLRAAGVEVFAQAVDVTDTSATSRWVAATVERFGAVDVLVNNAGGADPRPAADLDDQAWQAAFDQNFFSAVALARFCAAEMRKRGAGSIVNISSIYGRESGGPVSYNASKAALISFTKMLARELGQHKIRVNAVAPGSIIYPGGVWETIFRQNPSFEKDFIAHEFPCGRLGRPEEVAYAVLMLASPRASWITGACVPVDGAQGRSNL
ncbi:MAG TPA: SDR family NAD(P)-dependent oxidoreductase [Candidatus Binataceae bacterium]|nr:SDR family NAD(P)-dependent oxidoreductase [Candidatus Binataceae bacterium]